MILESAFSIGHRCDPDEVNHGALPEVGDPCDPGCFPVLARGQSDPLPSWRDGPAKQSILGFVERVTREGGPDFVPVPQRIATFDNDGTLWCEQPVYVQGVFVRDRIGVLAKEHPEWRDTEPFKSVLSGDMKELAEQGQKALFELVTATHAGMTSDDFRMLVGDWIASAKHPRFNRLYTQCVYQPMLELLAYLRSRSFKTFIVSGGGVEFMRRLGRARVRHPSRAGHRQHDPDEI